MVREAVGIARAAGACSPSRCNEIRTQRAVVTIAEDAWAPVNYPGAVLDPDIGEWISKADVPEISVRRLRRRPRAVSPPSDHRRRAVIETVSPRGMKWRRVCQGGGFVVPKSETHSEPIDKQS